MTEQKNLTENFNSQLNQVEEKYQKNKDKTFKIIWSEEPKGKRMKKSEESLQDL